MPIPIPIQIPTFSEENIAYISPEQSGRINGELDQRSDFYSFGVTLFELFTGRPPLLPMMLWSLFTAIWPKNHHPLIN